jgi:NAD(P)-dependent dehydrogenase (short-subunit alcohol dehydrogenase family)
MESKERVALITGASSGIGKATALAFAREGNRVVLGDVSPEGEAVVKEIERLYGTPAVFLRCDVSNNSDVERLVQTAVNRFGRVDYAFNNAGIEGVQATTAECTEENWQRTIDVNLKGVWLCMKHEIPVMLKQGKGSIVNCASIAGMVGFPNIPAYVASKHGIIGLTQNAALEYAKQGIRINAVCPGVIDTPMVQRFTGNLPQNIKAMEAAEPVGRLGKPEEIADAVIWLSSDRASFVTGHSLAVDGGWTAQ